jgi:hypothetical protein
MILRGRKSKFVVSRRRRLLSFQRRPPDVELCSASTADSGMALDLLFAIRGLVNVYIFFFFGGGEVSHP